MSVDPRIGGPTADHDGVRSPENQTVQGLDAAGQEPQGTLRPRADRTFGRPQADDLPLPGRSANPQNQFAVGCLLGRQKCGAYHREVVRCNVEKVASGGSSLFLRLRQSGGALASSQSQPLGKTLDIFAGFADYSCATDKASRNDFDSGSRGAAFSSDKSVWFGAFGSRMAQRQLNHPGVLQEPLAARFLLLLDRVREKSRFFSGTPSVQLRTIVWLRPVPSEPPNAIRNASRRGTTKGGFEMDA